MKYAKILALVALTGSALMASVGTASATRVTSPAGTLYTGTVKFLSLNLKITNAFTFGTIQCQRTELEGNVSSHGSGVTAVGSFTSLTFTNCTGGKPTSPVVKPGSFELHYTSGSNGTVTSNGAEIIVHETLVGTCIFKTTNTDIGTFTGGTPASVDFNSSVIPQSSGNPFCPASATLTGAFTVTSPGTLLLDS